MNLSIFWHFYNRIFTSTFATVLQISMIFQECKSGLFTYYLCSRYFLMPNNSRRVFFLHLIMILYIGSSSVILCFGREIEGQSCV